MAKEEEKSTEIADKGEERKGAARCGPPPDGLAPVPSPKECAVVDLRGRIGARNRLIETMQGLLSGSRSEEDLAHFCRLQKKFEDLISEGYDDVGTGRPLPMQHV